MKKIISTDLAPAAIGPYSQAIQYGDLLFVSGQIPIDPETGELVGGDIEVQTKQIWKISRSLMRFITVFSKIVCHRGKL